MTDEEKFVFDLQGYIVLKGVVPRAVLKAANSALDRYETMPQENYPEPLCLGQDRSESNLYISNILEGDKAFIPFVDIPKVIDVIAGVTGASWRLNHTYTIYRWKGGQTGLHMHGTPIIDKCQYRCENGQILSTLTKAVFPLLDCEKDDGAFAVVPGSHKSSLPSPHGSNPDVHPHLRPVEAEAGDCIIFTEALTHGSYANSSAKPRRTLYFCYSIGWMGDWGCQGLHFSDRAKLPLTPDQRQILAVK